MTYIVLIVIKENGKLIFSLSTPPATLYPSDDAGKLFVGVEAICVLSHYH